MSVTTLADLDLTRAKGAVRDLNATRSEPGFTYRLARVELDAEPPIGQVVEVKASQLSGVRLPEEPPVAPSPMDVYVPPEERGAFVVVPTHVAEAEVAAAEPLDLVIVADEIGQHQFPLTGPMVCIDCGCDPKTAQDHRACPA